MTASEADLMQAILRDPANDLPRLVFADEIEGDEPAMAEFIRCQIAHSAIPIHECDRIYPGCTVDMSGPYVGHNHKCRGYEPQQRYIALWDKYGEQWFGKNDFKMDVVRGWPARISCTLAAFVGEDCPTCTRPWLSENLNALGRLIGLNVPCPTCKGTACVPGLVDSIGKRWPITEIRFTDFYPTAESGDVWSIAEEVCDFFELGDFIYSTADYANAVLQRAAIDLLRTKANLPPLYTAGNRAASAARSESVTSASLR